MRIAECQLAILVYIMSACLGPSDHRKVAEESKMLDAQSCAFSLQLMRMMALRHNVQQQTNDTLSRVSTKHLDLALLYFVSQFHRIYIGHQDRFLSRYTIYRTSIDDLDHDEKKKKETIYSRMSQTMGQQTTESNVLTAIIAKIMQNLKFWAKEKAVLSESLQMLGIMARGYYSEKLVADLPMVKQILMNHTHNGFPFMNVDDNDDLRTTFYNTMGNLIFADSNVEHFDTFMSAFENTALQIARLNDQRSDPRVRLTFIGLCRDLQGVLQGAVSSKAYAKFFEWIYPRVLSVFVLMLETFFDDPKVTTAILSFMIELVHDRRHRIEFPQSCAHGYQLFREAMKVVATYGNRMLQLTDPVEDLYSERLKGISLCMDLLTKSMNGQYVNFGVFEMYNDQCLVSALNTMIKLILSVKQSEMLSYTDVSLTYFAFLRVLFEHHMKIVVKLDSRVFLPLVTSLIAGVQNFNREQSGVATEAIDNVFSWRILQGTMVERDDASKTNVNRFDQHMKQSRGMPAQLFETLFNLLLFGSIDHHWVYSRALLSVMLFDRSAFSNFQQRLLQKQPQEVHERLLKAFNALQKDIKANVTMTNRDNFCRNMTQFMNTVHKFIVRPNDLPYV
eukprot:TRINITY_DN104733_c0_g1_i1.p1 TRINITY_DN104733_c0_g1~~TRINITY_DN104733_c0_g1_i1.p1  ORF type:complete len:705 (+),score=416.64 TRINITY_DN104733_c0_g1_i1:264-2117(+)